MKKRYSLNDLPQVAQEVLANSKYKILLFYGEMGAGKTTLIKEIVKQLNVLDNVSSPTFSLVNEYHTQENESVFHFDFYRIDDETEALDMGVEEYFYSNNWCLVEWPNKVENLLPLKSTIITISIDSDQLRTLEISYNE
jgi:tRNA threonylcarbamoyladenosine biosynthesis protein TsaE